MCVWRVKSVSMTSLRGMFTRAEEHHWTLSSEPPRPWKKRRASGACLLCHTYKKHPTLLCASSCMFKGVCAFVSRYCTCTVTTCTCFVVCVYASVCLYVPFCTRCYKLSCECVCLCTFVWVLPNIRGIFLLIGELQMKGAYESHSLTNTHTHTSCCFDLSTH